ncbi:MAG: alanine--tRNA ligase [Meiothermus sp.]|uniref:alanine--tRNA ligase n=1 Tax=Meiothermus sp. TaxID=1955249 RepID=UPI0025DC8663|nr:alanine--tRNA ligase [Meiothermus sp.]MCS7057581.1 alanine--tRNA ligase [Meiothermus sp.]MCS7195226.1 alanine--tRNA ligase [Meiothermus sp.]MCX7741380.1 alanine--tRNA ligase [Meiothermus sp.]MDW8091116.1 alanine--tRNA ligase [Meiothermus sp.]MDW8482357.1 alanine--tRNA ligase [Meiothermus sp.]
MTTAEIREKFLRFFESKGHLRLPSFSVVPEDDPTLLFINAGMTPLKPYFMGKKPVFPGHEGEWYRVTTCQKSVRTGDIENVGRTNRHQTVFEMLGNFSFGDYFKKEAIEWAWEFLTSPEWLGLDPDRIYVTIYIDDDEAFSHWTRVGVPPERIHRFGADENFWPQNAPTQGPNGPCGPCSEIYYDRGPEFGSDTWADYYETRESNRFVEIWNLVFPQYNRKDGGVLEPLPKPNIDTGMGLSRVAMVLQGVTDFYETDEFRPLIDKVVELAGVSYEGPRSVAHRVIAEHARAVTFILSDGVHFSNTGRGYVVRRLLRRAVRFGYLLGLREPFLYRLAEVVAEVMGGVYPELRTNLESVQKQIRIEEEQFFRTLEAGIKRLDAMLSGLKPGHTLSGKDAFTLYDTYGFPLDLTIEIAGEHGIQVDTEGFERALEEQQERARAKAAFSRELFHRRSEALAALASDYGGTVFVGYESLEAQAQVKLMLVGEQAIEEAPKGTELQVALDRTPFYAEGGGQVGDTGVLEWEGGWARVLTTQKSPEGVYLHLARVEEGTLRAGTPVRALVDPRRRDTERNHTATHLLHAALRAVLGPHVQQRGSYVGPDRLRFDFSQFEPISPRDLARVEMLVNRWIQADFPVSYTYKPLEEARKEGAMALFGEKYGDVVRVVSVEGSIDGVSSKELCGGCHVRRTGEIGSLVIVGEEAVAAGVRRIEALTGTAATAFVRETLERVQALGRELGVPPEQLGERVRKLQDELKGRERELERLRLELARSQLGGSTGAALREAGGYRYLAVQLTGLEAGALRGVADELLEKHKADLVAVGSGQNLVIKVGKAALERGLDAGAVMRRLAEAAGGRGGGKGGLAQGGGFNLEKAFAALERALG